MLNYIKAKFRYRDILYSNISCIISALIVFVASAIVGIIIAAYNLPLVILHKDTYASSGYFIIHNLRALVLAYMGFLSFGVTSFYLLVLDGIVTGNILFLGPKYFSVANAAARFLPHSVFEIPGIILAGAAGFKMPQVLIRHLRGGDFLTKHDICGYLVMVVISVTLIVVAGFIEADVTPFAIRLASP